jgi:flagellar hook protein FlgE
MGLSSVFNTAITGLQASEATIDVAGNNVANSNTIGFKESEALFSTQFLQQLSLGSAPTATSGGTNPRQIGLGTQVAAIRPVFTQGTIAISSSPSDLAMQGDGFFIVQSTTGEQLYTRNGKFELNSQSELVTAGGERLLGFGVDDNFQIQPTTLTTLTIPIGAAAVAKSTENVFLQGTLTPTGQVADLGSIIESRIFSDGSKGVPPDTTTSNVVSAPTVTNSVTYGTSGAMAAGTYHYKIVLMDANGNVSPASSAIDAVVTAPDDEVTFALPNPIPSDFTTRLIYRASGSGPYQYLASDATAGPYTDSAASVPGSPPSGVAGTLTESTLAVGAYSYYVTFNNPTGSESRPTSVIGPLAVTSPGQRIHLKNIPTPTAPEYTEVKIYRSLSSTSTQPGEDFLVATLTGGEDTYIDGASDASIESNQQINLNGPAITSGTALKDVVYRDGTSYAKLFQPGTTFADGTFTFSGRKGDRALTAKSMHVDATTTVQEMTDFMDQAMGIQAIAGNEGASITGDSRLQFLGNTGADNDLEIRLSGLQFTVDGETTPTQLNMNFTTAQAARGQSAVADFVVYDSLGIPAAVRITTVLESRSATETVYRWFADSGDNDPLTGADISVGTGEISFDGEGRLIGATTTSVAISRSHLPSISPLEFQLNFDQVSGLSADTSSLSATRQDGFPPGKLTSYLIGEDGKIRGVFDNGTERDLGQVRLARFANPAGLDQRGKNLFGAGVNSGLPVVGNPGEQGIGSVISGAVEQSNADISKNLINLITASTQYRGNARVITAAQQLLDELLNLRR